MATILVIDDESSLCALLRSVLEGKGFEVVTAGSGKLGIALFEKTRPQAVVLDLKMPDLDGLTVLERLQHIDPHTPVIIFTGVNAPESQWRALEIGAAEVVGKEFSLHRLGDALTRVLNPPVR